MALGLNQSSDKTNLSNLFCLLWLRLLKGIEHLLTTPCSQYAPVIISSIPVERLDFS